MSKRGRVLRDPHMGPGLLIVEGKQYPFFMEGVWRSEVPAKPGLVVSVDFDANENIVGISAVPLAQLDKERTERVPPRSSFRNMVFDSWDLGTGSPGLAAVAGLMTISWFSFNAVSIHLPLFGKIDLTFWQILGYLNAGGLSRASDVGISPDPGVFGFLAILVLAGSFLPYIWKDQRAWVAGLLPLAFMVFVASRLNADVHAVFALQASDGSVVSLGLGAYLSGSLAICISVLSAKQWMGSRRPRETELARSQHMAA